MSLMRRIRSALTKTLDVPSGALGERVCVSTGGFFDTTVDGCDSIVDYSPSHVVLDCASERVIIEGDSLSVSAFALGRVRICGRVDSITNCRADKATAVRSNPNAAGSAPDDAKERSTR